MNMPGFDRAQAAYDNALPPEYEPFQCKFSGESDEDCAGPGCEGFLAGRIYPENCILCGLTEDNHHDECEPEADCDYCGPHCHCDDDYERFRERDMDPFD